MPLGRREQRTLSDRIAGGEAAEGDGHFDTEYDRGMSGSVASMTLPPGEPAAGPWRAVSEADLVRALFDAAGVSPDKPVIVAVDGRSASGKTTLAERLARQVDRSAIVHTDDVAWNEPFFAWGDLLGEHIRSPLRRGQKVTFSPPAWAQHGRDGAIEVGAGLELVIVEGVGASQRELSDLVDATVWVQSDFAAAETRGVARDIAQGVNGNAEEAIAFWHEWMDEELQFLSEQRPWERACTVVAGTPTIPLDRGQLAVARGPLSFGKPRHRGQAALSVDARRRAESASEVT
jgi:uridine kinase